MPPSIFLEYEQFSVHPFRPEELYRYQQLIQEIYQLLSDEETLKFIPEKRLKSLVDAESWLKTNILNFHCGKNFLHFITEKASGRLLGMIDLIPPAIARIHYRIERYPYFIEFYLKGKMHRRQLMTNLLPLVIDQLRKYNIEELGVVLNRNNHAAHKVVLNAGFSLNARFDQNQDFYYLHLAAKEQVMQQVG